MYSEKGDNSQLDDIFTVIQESSTSWLFILNMKTL